MISAIGPAIHTDTAQAGTKEWLEASKDMVIVAYIGKTAAVPPAATDEDDERIFGTHIKETVKAFRNLFGEGT